MTTTWTTTTTMMMDEDICNMFGALSLSGWSPDSKMDDKANLQGKGIGHVEEVLPLYTPAQSEPEVGAGGGRNVGMGLMQITDSQGYVQFIPSHDPPTPPTTASTLSCVPAASSVASNQTINSNPNSYSSDINFGEADSGCPLLQSLLQSFQWHTAPSHNSSYLDTILTHREAFAAFPAGHRRCSAALTQIAFGLERRAQEGVVGHDNSGDLDTAIALHQEAWLISGWA